MEQTEVRQHVLDILNKTHLMSLAVVDDGGPWVCDVIFIYDEGPTLYWLSEIRMRHSKAILKDSRVAATITTNTKSGVPNEGLQISGAAEKIEGEQVELGIKHWNKRGRPLPADNKFLDEARSWYKFTPNKIELIYEPVLGYGKAQLEL